MNNSERIKRDIYDLYEVFYSIGQNDYSRAFLSTEVLKKLKYKPNEVKKVLNLDEHAIKKNNQDISSEVSSISTREQAIKYFSNNLAQIFRPEISEIEKNAILKKLTADELKHLYYIIFGINFEGKCKKIDIIYKIKEFCEDEKRTADLIKNLY